MHLENKNSTPSRSIDVEDLICPICMSVADKPHITSCCRRVFCQKDADPDHYENGCPLCREMNYAFQLSPEHEAVLDQLTIKCQCSERIAPAEFDHHLERCLGTKFPCPHRTCQENNKSKQFNSQELINHLARFHCNEVPLLGSTFIEKKKVEPYQKVSMKYEQLVTTLYSTLYPKMIEDHLKHSPGSAETPTFKCPRGHKLIDADANKRHRSDGTVYSSPGYNCDVCRRSFSSGHSWHCSCSDSGYDKCVACAVFELHGINNPILHQAAQDNEEYQERHRRRIHRNLTSSQRGLIRFLTEHFGHSVDDEDGSAALVLRHPRSLRSERDVLDDSNEEQLSANLRED